MTRNKSFIQWKFIAAVLLVLSYLFFNYNYLGSWWHSCLGTFLIIAFGYLIWNDNCFKILGLNISLKISIYAIIIGIGLAGISAFLMKTIANKENIILSYTHWRSTFHIIFYVLNEEIVVGAITLFLLIKKLNLKAYQSSLLLAFAFSVVHLIFYRWIFSDRTFLQFSTLITLFFVGVIRNNLILQTGHIAFSWALHVAWMVTMFGFDHFFEGTEKILSESERFDLYLGSRTVLIISGILAALSLYFLIKGKIRFEKVTV